MEIQLLIFVIGLIAGAMNAAAGGRFFYYFPALIYAGVPPVSANASSTVALFPASLASAWEFKDYIQPFPKSMIIVTLIGGCIGALLLLYTPATNFKKIVPWLLLIGALAFAYGNSIGNYLQSKFQINVVILLTFQFVVGIYGGYFGGAVGIMMMAIWSLFGLTDIKIVNANKTLFVAVANSIAVYLFIAAGKVAWTETSMMLIATVCGGYFGAKYTKRLDPVRLRRLIIIFNFVITAVFYRYFHRCDRRKIIKDFII